MCLPFLIIVNNKPSCYENIFSMKFPLKYLGFYKTKKQLNPNLPAGLRLQYLKTDTNVYDGIETVHFKNPETEQVYTWILHSEELYDSWEKYLEFLSSP
jgi:hypothetical protein